MIDFTKIKFFSVKKSSFKGIEFVRKNNYRGFILVKKEFSGLKFPKVVNKGINVFKQLQPSEPQHSRILGTLLNPNGGHGFDALFLKIFFDIVIDDNDFPYSGNDKWIVTVEKNRFDISIRNRNSTKIIIIENKSNWADDQPNQLYRYWLTGIYYPQYNLEKYSMDCFSKILYLSPSFEKQYAEQSITRPETVDAALPIKVPEEIITTVYFKQQIADWLEKCMESAGKTEDIYYYIKQYRDYWR